MICYKCALFLLHSKFSCHHLMVSPSQTCLWDLSRMHPLSNPHIFCRPLTSLPWTSLPPSSLSLVQSMPHTARMIFMKCRSEHVIHWFKFCTVSQQSRIDYNIKPTWDLRELIKAFLPSHFSFSHFLFPKPHKEIIHIK